MILFLIGKKKRTVVGLLLREIWVQSHYLQLFITKYLQTAFIT